MIWVASKNTEEYELEIEAEKNRADEAEAGLEEAKDELEKLKSKTNDRSSRLSSAILNIERIHRDGSNPWALALAHNELDKALTKLILA